MNHFLVSARHILSRGNLARTAIVALLLSLIAVPMSAVAQSTPEPPKLFMPLITGDQSSDQMVYTAVSSNVVISEFRVRGPNGGSDEFVELYNLAASPVNIGGWKINGSNSSGTAGTRATIPTGTTLNPGCYYLLTNSSTSGGPYSGSVPGDQTYATGITDDGGLALLAADNTTIDAVGMSAGSAYKEGTTLASLGSSNLDRGYERKPGSIAGNGTDTDNNSADFQLITPSNPQNSASTCISSGGDAAPAVASTNPASGATDVAANDDIVITFNEAVNVTGSWFTVNCANSGAHTAVVSGGPTSFTLNPDNDFSAGENCTVTVFAANITDQDANDPPDTMAVDFSFSFTVLAPITLISAIQGSGSTVTPGTFTVEAIVIGNYQTQGSGQLRGFFLQEEDSDADGNPATSEGIFVFCSGCPTPVAVGDKIRVTGSSSEFFDMSQLTASTASSVSVLSSGNPLPTPATVDLPIPGVPSGDLAAATAAINAYFERIEGMLVTFPDTLTIAEYFELARYGQIILSEGGRPRQFTDANAPSVAGLIDHEINLASRTVILDDTNNRQNFPIDTTFFGDPDLPYYYPVPGLSTTNFFRGGDTITGLTGVLHWSFAGLSGTDAWRIRPVTEAFSYAFTPANQRPAAPGVGGDVSVASFNVLNYFLTVDTTSSNNLGVCGASTTLDCRGADSEAERERQQVKLTEALRGLDADVVGLIELENTPGVDPLAEIIADLNAATTPGTYAAINTGLVGTDAIKVGLIYKPGTMTPIGDPRIDNDPIHNRPPVAQLFEATTGARFIVVVNHFKSKGCDPEATGADANLGDGQSCYNAQRVLQAQALIDFLNNFVNETGEPDVLIIGDLNAYAKEDPITTLENAGYTDLVAAFGGANAYSYVFDGQLGYLDHALANSTLTPQVTGVAEWHINADEVPLFDYNDDVRDAGEATFEEESSALPLYEANQFRTSDHDPVIAGLALNAPPNCTNAIASATSLWPANHKFVPISVMGVTDPEGDSLTVTIDSVFQDEAVDAPDSGNTSPDAQGIGTATAEVRAERVGTGGNGRVYHIRFTANDGFGGTCSGEVTVGVPHSKKGTAVDEGALYDSTEVMAGTSHVYEGQVDAEVDEEAQEHDSIFLPFLGQ